jgi:hypothetical protein
LERELGTALDEFAQYREAAVGLLGPLTEEAWSRTAVFEDRLLSLRDLVTAMAEHDEEHLAPLTATVAETVGDGPFETASVPDGATPARVTASR